MSLQDHDIAELTERVWSSFLGLDLSRTEWDATADLATCVTGCVQIAGEWNGAVTLHCSEPLARQATSILFETEAAEATFEEMQDTIGELTNMIGGNFKVLLPQPTQLSLPAVIEGSDYSLVIPGTTPQHVIHFESDGRPLRVSILAKCQ